MELIKRGLRAPPLQGHPLETSIRLEVLSLKELTAP